MSMVWSLINNLELIVHLPLLNLQFPGNALATLIEIITIMKFELIPIQKWSEKLFHLSNDTSNFTNEIMDLLEYHP